MLSERSIISDINQLHTEYACWFQLLDGFNLAEQIGCKNGEFKLQLERLSEVYHDELMMELNRLVSHPLYGPIVMGFFEHISSRLDCLARDDGVHAVEKIMSIFGLNQVYVVEHFQQSMCAHPILSLFTFYIPEQGLMVLPIHTLLKQLFLHFQFSNDSLNEPSKQFIEESTNAQSLQQHFRHLVTDIEQREKLVRAIHCIREAANDFESKSKVLTQKLQQLDQLSSQLIAIRNHGATAIPYRDITRKTVMQAVEALRQNTANNGYYMQANNIELDLELINKLDIVLTQTPKAIHPAMPEDLVSRPQSIGENLIRIRHEFIRHLRKQQSALSEHKNNLFKYYYKLTLQWGIHLAELATDVHFNKFSRTARHIQAGSPSQHVTTYGFFQPLPCRLKKAVVTPAPVEDIPEEADHNPCPSPFTLLTFSGIVGAAAIIVYQLLSSTVGNTSLSSFTFQ